jgi:ABC-2 type transport system ATP-binding protein
MSSVKVIVTEALTKVYRSHLGKVAARAVDRLDLEIGENEVFGFLGQNGAGKTTTIKMLCSLLRPTSGRACVCGKDVRTREARRLIGYLPENPYFYEYLTPRETLDFYGQLAGLNRAGRAKEWAKLSELLDLASIASQRVREFSKGMRQRLGFAVALVGDPSVLILDEPMSGLDPLGRRRIREVIMQVHAAGKTVFFSSHLLGDVEQICDRVGILVRGKLTVTGRLDELLTRRIRQIEIIAAGIDGAHAMPPEFRNAFVRRSEDGEHFLVGDMESANRLVQAVYAQGGRLFSFVPVRESLEDYFMHQQEAADASLGSREQHVS